MSNPFVSEQPNGIDVATMISQRVLPARIRDIASTDELPQEASLLIFNPGHTRDLIIKLIPELTDVPQGQFYRSYDSTGRPLYIFGINQQDLLSLLRTKKPDIQNGVYELLLEELNQRATIESINKMISLALTNKGRDYAMQLRQTNIKECFRKRLLTQAIKELLEEAKKDPLTNPESLPDYQPLLSSVNSMLEAGDPEELIVQIQ